MPIRHRRTRQIAWVRCPTSVSRCLTMTVAACSATVFTGTNDIVATGAPLDHRLYHFLCIPYSADTPLARHLGHLSRHPRPITAACPPSRPSLPSSAPDHRRLPAIPAISPVIRARPPPLAHHPARPPPRSNTAAFPPPRSPATPAPTPPLSRHPARPPSSPQHRRFPATNSNPISHPTHHLFHHPFLTTPYPRYCV